MHFLIGLGILAGFIGFAFGERTARAVVQGVLIICGLAFAYVMFRTVSGTI